MLIVTRYSSCRPRTPRPARRDLQVEHRAVAHVGPAARQPVGESAVALEVVGTTPCPRTWWRAPLAVRRSRPVRRPACPSSRASPAPAAPLRFFIATETYGGYVGPAVVVVSGHRAAYLTLRPRPAAGRARPCASSSSSLISVSSASPPPASDAARQSALGLDEPSIRSSTVPRHTNLCTSTFLLLADAERAVGRLVLDRRVPPAVEVHHVRRRGEVEPACRRPSARARRTAPPRPPGTAARAPAACPTGVPPCSTRPGPAEDVVEERRQRLGRLAELGEDEHLLLLRGDASAISRRRASLPLSASAHAPSPSHWDG